MIRNVFHGLRDIYQLKFASYKPLTSKTFRLRTINDDYYFTKKSELYTKEKYNFLYNQGIDNILYPIKNNFGEFVSIYDNNIYFVSDYINDLSLVGEIKAMNLVEELTNLHKKTIFKRQLSVSFSRLKTEQLYEYLQYKLNTIEAFIRTIEARPFDEYSITILKNYRYLLDAKTIMGTIHRKLIAGIKEKKSVYFSFVHNNPKINHLLSYNGHHFLTSIERSKVGLTSLDLAKFYIENSDINIDMKSIITSYFKIYDDTFYIEYFYFLVLLYLIKGLIIYDKDYVTSQSFLYTTSEIKKFIDIFDLNKEDS